MSAAHANTPVDATGDHKQPWVSAHTDPSCLSMGRSHSIEMSLILKDLFSVKHVIRCSVLLSNQDMFLADLQKAAVSTFMWANAFKNWLLGFWVLIDSSSDKPPSLTFPLPTFPSPTASSSS